MQPVEGAVIACAGLGSRLGLGLPKCMIEVEGQTILSRLIRSLRSHVPRIHVVVGYREDIVTEYCTRYYRDVVLVRNPSFRTTNTAYSYALGSVGFSKKVLFMDGDLLIEQQSLASFINAAAQHELLVGITKAKTEQAIFAETTVAPSVGTRITGFTREHPQGFEWANIFSGSPDLLSGASGFVYEALQQHLPVTASEIDLYEIDTQSDLVRAHQFFHSRRHAT